MMQQGQVLKLKSKGRDGEPLWAYRYRVEGRGSARFQMGGFATKAEAQKALQTKLARLLPGGRAATMTVSEWVEEYLATHQGERVTIAKLRWSRRRSRARPALWSQSANTSSSCCASAGRPSPASAHRSWRSSIAGVRTATSVATSLLRPLSSRCSSSSLPASGPAEPPGWDPRTSARWRSDCS